MTSPTAILVAATVANVAGLAAWIVIIGGYLVRTMVQRGDPDRIRSTWVPMPVGALVTVAGFNLAVQAVLAVARPTVGTIVAAAIWTVIVVAFVTFGRASRQRMVALYTSLDRCDYLAAVADRRIRTITSRMENTDPGTSHAGRNPGAAT